MTRRHRDLYETGSAAVDALLRRVDVGYQVIEPCAGGGAIARALVAGPGMSTNRYVYKMDIDRTHTVHAVADASTVQVPERMRSWDVVTNPPYVDSLPLRILENLHVRQGMRCAFLLRLSWLEPTPVGSPKRGILPRREFMRDHPPSRVIVLPRFSYTGDGKSDSVTCFWGCWGWPAAPLEIATEVGHEEVPA